MLESLKKTRSDLHPPNKQQPPVPEKTTSRLLTSLSIHSVYPITTYRIFLYVMPSSTAPSCQKRCSFSPAQLFHHCQRHIVSSSILLCQMLSPLQIKMSPDTNCSKRNPPYARQSDMDSPEQQLMLMLMCVCVGVGVWS